MPNTEAGATLPPQNLEAEELVLGAMMLSPHAIDVVTQHVSARDFYRDAHARLFTACLTLHNASAPVDAVTVAAHLENAGTLTDAGGRERIHEIATLVSASSNAGHYARIVRVAAVERGLTVVGERIRQLGWAPDGRDPSALLEEAEGLLFDLAGGGARSDFVSLDVAVADAYQRLLDLHEGGRAIIGAPTGFADLDRLTSGLQPGNLVLIAARPSMGKSGLGIGIAAHTAIREEKPVALFTLEMSQAEVVQRLLSAEALVESEKLRNGRMSREEWSAVAECSGRLGRAPLFIDDNRLIGHTDIRSKARRLKLRHPDLALVVVDYLQLMARATNSSERVNEVAQISRSLKILAGELNVPVVALSQLSRNLESRHDRRPILSDLRDSGALEQDADLVLFIYRDEVYNPEDPETAGIAELILAKHRNGPTGTVKTAFVSRYAKFSQLPRPGAGDVR